MTCIQIDVHRQYYVVHNNGEPIAPNILKIVDSFYRRFVIREVMDRREVITIYAIKVTEDREFRFPISSIGEFVNYLKMERVIPGDISVNRIPEPKYHKLTAKVAKGMKPRDYQEYYIDYLVNNDYPTKILTLQMGKGKTFTSLASITQLDLRLAITVLPRYIEKWEQDVQDNTNIKSKDILSIRGGKMLREAMMAVLDGGELPKVTIFSNRTLQNLLTEYIETHGVDWSYPMTLEEFFEAAGFGIMLYDEVHQHFATGMKLSLLGDVKYIIGCSATLESYNQSTEQMYHYMFPSTHRPKSLKYDKYIHVYAVGYNINKKWDIRTSFFGQKFYNHIAYEKSIFSKPYLKRDYLDMIYTYLVKGYLNTHKPGQKALVFVASVKLATILTEFIKTKQPKYDVRRYVDDDPMENILESDICVTTIGSGGTALDIPDLVTVIQTVGVFSVQANKQSIGRLRKIDGEDVKFYYLYNRDIPAHLRYHKARKEQWAPLTFRFYNLGYSKVLG